MNRAVPALAVALLLLASGCLGGVQAPEQHFEDDEMVSLVTDMNATDARTLYVDHWQTLANASSFRGHVEVTLDSRLYYRKQIAVSRANERYRLRGQFRNDDEPGYRIATTDVDEAGKYERVRSNASTDFDTTVTDGPPDGFFGPKNAFSGAVQPPDETVISRYDFKYVGREHGAYVFEADGLKDPEDLQYSHFYWDLEDAENGSARLVVEDSGVIRSFSSTVTLRRDGETTTRHYELAIRHVNRTVVETPTWVESA